MSKEKDIIKKIVIDIAGTEIAVTPQQAKALHFALQELLGLDKPNTKIIERETIRDRWPLQWPAYWGTFTKTIDTSDTYPQPLKIWYHSGTATLSIT